MNKGSVQAELFLDWAKEHDVHVELVELTCSESEPRAMLNRGDTDLYVSLDTYYEVGSLFPVSKIGESDSFFAVNHSRPDIVPELNSAMSKILEDNRNYNQMLQEKYISTHGSNLFLTSQELKRLSQNE